MLAFSRGIVLSLLGETKRRKDEVDACRCRLQPRILMNVDYRSRTRIGGFVPEADRSRSNVARGFDSIAVARWYPARQRLSLFRFSCFRSSVLFPLTCPPRRTCCHWPRDGTRNVNEGSTFDLSPRPSTSFVFFVARDLRAVARFSSGSKCGRAATRTGNPRERYERA